MFIVKGDLASTAGVFPTGAGFIFYLYEAETLMAARRLTLLFPRSNLSGPGKLLPPFAGLVDEHDHLKQHLPFIFSWLK